MACFLIQLYGIVALQIIERSLPKRQKVKKDPSMIEKEEMDKIGKYWVNIVRKDIPKHHRNFTNFHKKQVADAKRFSETCQREVDIALSGASYLTYHVFILISWNTKLRQ